MRHIGSIPDETDARRFGDYLLTAGMRNSVEEGASGWAIWVEHDDHVDAAKAELDAFRANPGDAKYNGASRQAAKIRGQQEKKQERLQKLHHDVRTSWGSTRQWAQPVTISLILLSLLAAAATAVGKNETGPAMNALRIQSVAFVPDSEGGGVLVSTEPLHDVRRGQVWRLITPIFLHFGAIHLIFNMFWLFDLGGQIERARGSLFLVLLVLAASILPNVAEYFWSESPMFGGMSGVVYALFGYVWIKGKYEPHLNMGVSQQTVLILMIWLVICMIGIIPHVANMAHFVGLVVGVAMAYGPIELRRVRRRLKS